MSGRRGRRCKAKQQAEAEAQAEAQALHAVADGDLASRSDTGSDVTIY